MTPSPTAVYPIIKALGRGIWSSAETPAGLLVVLSQEGTTDVTEVLRASGYTVTETGSSSVMVGGVDPIALLEAQITVLAAQRDALVAASRAPERVGSTA